MKDYKPNINALVNAARSEGIRLGLEAAKQAIEMNRDEYDAVRLNGIRLGLEAAAKAADAYDNLAAKAIQRLNPETIAKEADNGPR